MRLLEGCVDAASLVRICSDAAAQLPRRGRSADKITEQVHFEIW